MPKVYRQVKNRRGERRCGKPGCGVVIQPGEPYFKFSFRYGGTNYRCKDHYPRPSELTQSKMSEVYAAVEDLEAELSKLDSSDDLEQGVQEVGEIARQIADEYEEAAEAFGGEGENQERAEELGSWADELESFELEDVEEGEDKLEAWRDQAIEVIGECPL